ncbi:linear amide C-N hydrolase [Cetobacterium ceti]
MGGIFIQANACTGISLKTIYNGKIEIFKNKVGVIVNAPGYRWQTTNLNNYINLQPGDVTPPSRFSSHICK